MALDFHFGMGELFPAWNLTMPLTSGWRWLAITHCSSASQCLSLAVRIPKSQGIAGECASENKLIVIDDAYPWQGQIQWQRLAFFVAVAVPLKVWHDAKVRRRQIQPWIWWKDRCNVTLGDLDPIKSSRSSQWVDFCWATMKIGVTPFRVQCCHHWSKGWKFHAWCFNFQPSSSTGSA